jgi:hypothetical protein
MRFLIALLVASFAAPLLAAQPDRNPPAKYNQPIDVYQKRVIEGWTVLISPQLLATPDKLQALLSESDRQLKQIRIRLPAQAVWKLQEVRIWAELDNRPSCCYHPNPKWLAANNYNVDKARDIEIGSVEEFVNWGRRSPVNTLLHELCHAYHHRVLGFDHPEIKSAYEAARKSGIYDSILRENGQKVRHYAMVDPAEYFAELSETYFVANDYFPFVRAELQQHDPVMFQIIRRVWGDR